MAGNDLMIRISADTSGLTRGTEQAKRDLGGVATAAKSVETTGRTMASGLRTSLTGISLALGPLAAALVTVGALKGLVKIADDAIEADNKIKQLAGDTQSIQPTISGAFTEIRNAVVKFATAVNDGTGIVGGLGRILSEVGQVIVIFAKQLTGAGNESDKLKSSQGAAEFARNVGRMFAWAGDVVSAVARIIIDVVSTIVGAVRTAATAIGGLGEAMTKIAKGDFSGAADTMRKTMAAVSDSVASMVDKGVADLKRLTDAITGNGPALAAYQNQVAMGTRTDLSDPTKPKKDGATGDPGVDGGGDSGDGLFPIDVYAKRMKDTQERLRAMFVKMPTLGGAGGGAGGKPTGDGEEKGPLAQIMGAGLDTLSNTFGSALDSILTRSKTFGQAMAGVWGAMRSAILKELATIVQKQISAWATEKGISLGKISANAATAASGAASAVASIPYVGPILAIAAMGTVLAAVLGLGAGVKSAAGGFDIPAGLNPVTQLHQEEMVLPADIANPLRSQIAGGGGGNFVLNMQGTSAGDFFIVHQSEMVRALKAAQRNFGLF